VFAILRLLQCSEGNIRVGNIRVGFLGFGQNIDVCQVSQRHLMIISRASQRC
jgi:hypothetical protein